MTSKIELPAHHPTCSNCVWHANAQTTLDAYNEDGYEITNATLDCTPKSKHHMKMNAIAWMKPDDEGPRGLSIFLNASVACPLLIDASPEAHLEPSELLIHHR